MDVDLSSRCGNCRLLEESNVFSNDQPLIRPIVVRAASTESQGMGDGTEALPTSSFVNLMETAMGADNLDAIFNANYEKIIETKLMMLEPCVSILDIASVMNRSREGVNAVELAYKNFSQLTAVNRKAVLLLDIEPRWYTLDGSLVLVIPNNHIPTTSCDVIGNIPSKTQKNIQNRYNYFEAQQQLDTFWIKTLLQHIVSYFDRSWFELTLRQRYMLSNIVEDNENLSVFDQLKLIGYDCILRKHNKRIIYKIIEYNEIIEGITKIPSNKTFQDLAVDFALNFTSAQDVVDACDQHFELCSRSRMAYTKMFNK